MKDKQMENIILPGLEFTLRPSEVSLWLLHMWHRTCAAGMAAGGQAGSPITSLALGAYVEATKFLFRYMYILYPFC